MSEDMEVSARQLGWVPKEEFRGDEAKWVDAETFVDRGRNIMPILRKNNERLEMTIRQQQEEMARMRETVRNAQESVDQLREFHTAETKRQVEAVKRDLMSQLKEAKSDGDVDREVQLTDQLTQVNAELKNAETKEKEPPQQQQQQQQQVPPGIDRTFLEWSSANQWYGVDQRRTALATAIGHEIRANSAYDHLTGKAFFDMIDQELVNRTGGNPTSKVEGGHRDATNPGGSSKGAKTFAALPDEAKKTCERQAAKLVGEGRSFKDMKAWQEYYAKVYYAGEE